VLSDEPGQPVRIGNGNHLQILDDRRFKPTQQINCTLFQGVGKLDGRQGIDGVLLVDVP